jgi:hypothetical protein
MLRETSTRLTFHERAGLTRSETTITAIPHALWQPRAWSTHESLFGEGRTTVYHLARR